MKPGKIRVLALCIIWRGAELLLTEGYDPAKSQTFYRPLGGGIEFGERGIDAAAREMREELDAEIVDLRYLGTLENIFVFNNEPGHEIVLMYEGRFTDPARYDLDEMVGHEEGDGPFRVVWRAITDFDAGLAPLYPDGLLEMLTLEDDDGTPAA